MGARMVANEQVLRVLEEDYQPTCACAVRKCGPHRCWPSRVAWWGLGGMVLYAIVMHSAFAVERREFHGHFSTTLRQQLLTEVQESQQKVQQQFLQVASALVQQRLSSVVEHEQRLAELLRRTEQLNWVLATPELERAIQLRETLQAVQQQIAERERP